MFIFKWSFSSILILSTRKRIIQAYREQADSGNSNEIMCLVKEARDSQSVSSVYASAPDDPFSVLLIICLKFQILCKSENCGECVGRIIIVKSINMPILTAESVLSLHFARKKSTNFQCSFSPIYMEWNGPSRNGRKWENLGLFNENFSNYFETYTIYIYYFWYMTTGNRQRGNNCGREVRDKRENKRMR